MPQFLGEQAKETQYDFNTVFWFFNKSYVDNFYNSSLEITWRRLNNFQGVLYSMKIIYCLVNLFLGNMKI